MPRQQEIRNPLFDSVLVPARPADEFTFLHACLDEDAVQVFGCLAGELVCVVGIGV
jgi:hypothetical protein